MKKTILLLTLILNLIIAENYSLRFTQGNYARLPQITSLQNATEITMEIWYYEESSNGEDNIIGGEFGGDFEFYRDQDATIDWGEHLTQVESSGWSQNEWIHIAGTFEPGVGRKLFINGQLVDTCSDCGIGITDDPLTINRHVWYSGESARLTGYVDELRISNIVRYNQNFELLVN